MKSILSICLILLVFVSFSTTHAKQDVKKDHKKSYTYDSVFKNPLFK